MFQERLTVPHLSACRFWPPNFTGVFLLHAVNFSTPTSLYIQIYLFFMISKSQKNMSVSFSFNYISLFSFLWHLFILYTYIKYLLSTKDHTFLSELNCIPFERRTNVWFIIVWMFLNIDWINLQISDHSDCRNRIPSSLSRARILQFFSSHTPHTNLLLLHLFSLSMSFQREDRDPD